MHGGGGGGGVEMDFVFSSLFHITSPAFYDAVNGPNKASGLWGNGMYG